MVPDIASKGHSFKGAMAYYLHDKREGDGPNPTTAERVDWTDTRNLATDNPELAMRIMVATAKDADRLKAAAGIKNTGRKSNAHVYAYSLAWHPDEAAMLDRAEMARAVDSSLKALGADHLQAVLVCHRDQKHPHVHVVLNRVDPATGKMHPFSNDRLILSDWANAYERERGQILTPLREEKRELRQQFTDQAARRDHVKNTPREQSPAVMLKELGNAQKVAHGQQWFDLSARHTAAKDAIYTAYGEKTAAATAQHKADTKALWAQHFRDARAEQKRFEQQEQGFAGRIRNALDAVTHQQITGAAGDRNRLTLAFNNVLSSQARRAAFDGKQEIGRAAFSKALRGELDARMAAFKGERDTALSVQRDAFTADRAALIVKQDAERAKIREAWAQLKTRAQSDQVQGETRQRAARPAPSAEDKKRQWVAREVWQARRENRAVKSFNRGQARIRPEVQQQENPAMKDAFDKNRNPVVTPPPVPTVTQRLATPSPAPSPAGVVRSPDRPPAQVPVVDRAAAWAATPEGQKVVKDQAPPTPARKDWATAAAPVTATPAPKKDWGAAASQKPTADPLPTRGRDFDRDR